MSTLWPFPDDALRISRFPAASPVLSGLHRALHAGTVPNTLLLVGEPLAGREAVAAELSAMLICPEGRLFCTCSSCQRVRQGVHPDLHLLRVGVGHKEIRMEDVEEVLANFQQVPFEGRRRVYVLANAHTPPLNVFAASALLKTLEEPVAHACWILLACNPLRVLPTIVSRAVQLRVPSSPAAAAENLGPRALTLLQAVPGSLGALVEEGEEGEGFLQLAQELLPQAMNGNYLALLRLSALVRERPWRASLLSALSLASASQVQPELAERAVALAEGWLLAQRLSEQLYLGFEATALASLGRVLEVT
ncbi:hypothetical protein EG19_10775 [Thermoanaerobaculum aquaticum]|uniref:DNA polymerase III subunit delta n=1 Tax=Thermoanaerobaculum aquaticum TaxID=1312852 RepID=A0A062Y1H6_9BACT|nr:hypothetical protein [Thermoanaerobaculum aquaticum]KDA54635.1 hypothetical protein EG19_10775 [Thermoanaerobaculum aquaticum]